MWTDAGIYEAVLTVAWGGCVSTTETHQIEILDNPPVDAGSNHAICPGETVDIGTPAQPDITYSWSPGNMVSNPNSAQTQAVGVNTTNATIDRAFVLTANEQGCLSRDTVFVTVYAKPTA